MTLSTESSLKDYCIQTAQDARKAGRDLNRIGGEQRNRLLLRIADGLEEASSTIQSENEKDLANADKYNLTPAMVDRLRLTDDRIAGMATSVRQIAAQTDPIGQVIEGYVRPNGLQIQKVRVPIGVVFFIYESRPNVSSDAAALCIKSGNALILRGGKEALHSNLAIVNIIRDAIEAEGINPDIVQLINTTDREAVSHLLKLNEDIDVVIPRGGEGLIRAVVEQSRIPVIKHYTGNCHVYVDEYATGLSANEVRDICVNSKTHRTGVCNATESFLFHADVPELMIEACKALAEKGVELRVCEKSAQLLEKHIDKAYLIPANEDDWSTEYLAMIAAVKIVESRQEAINHINQFGSGHTDAILSANVKSADDFVQQVDSADVMVNCSTRFSDGGEYGLGAEIGISTDKLHARGPMGALDMTTYKWVVRGNGQIRP